MKMYPVVAHISDLHFGIWNHCQEAEDGLLQHLVQEQPRPDFIVVSGDLTQIGRKKEMKSARLFLQTVLQQLANLGHDTRCIVVPGNHDIGPYGRLVFWKRLSSWNKIFPTWGLGPLESRSEFDACSDLETFYLNEAISRARKQGGSISEEQARSEAKYRAKKTNLVCEYYPAFGIAFLKIDSNKVFPWILAAGKVGGEQLRVVRETVNDYRRAFPRGGAKLPFDDAWKVAVLHHHVHHLPRTGNDKGMFLKDAGIVWKQLMDLGTDLILHGHKHYATHLGLTYFSSPEAERRTMVLSAGTTTSQRTHRQPNSYYRFEFGGLSFSCQRHDFQDMKFSSSGPNISIVKTPRLPIPVAGVGPIDEHAQRLMLEVNPLMIDDIHRYRQIIVESEINAERDYFAKARFIGVNESSSPSTCINGEVIVVGSLSLEDINLRAWNGDQANDTLHTRSLPIGDIHRLMFHVLFKKAVAPGDTFDVSYSFRLPRVMYRRDDYDIINLARFQRGVERLSYTVSTPLRLASPMFFEVHRSELSYYKGGTSCVSVGESGSKFCVDVKNPTSMGYLFFYHELSQGN